MFRSRRVRTPPPLYAYRWPRTTSPFQTTRPAFQYPPSDSDVPDKQDKSPPLYVEEVEPNKSNPDIWSGPMPHAPIPPSWDNRFYAGIPREADQAELRRSFRSKTTDSRKRSESRPCRRERHGKKMFIDLDEPYWRGVRVNLVGADLVPLQQAKPGASQWSYEFRHTYVHSACRHRIFHEVK